MQKQGSIMRQIIILMIILFSGTMVALPDLTYHDLDWNQLKLNKRLKQDAILSTNIRDGITPEVFNYPLATRIYDIRIVAYSQWFADMYGYPNDYVSEMPEGMQLIQFSMVTHGVDIETNFHILLDNDLGLDIPTQNYTNKIREGIRLPKQLSDEESVQWWKTDKDRLERQRKLSKIRIKKDKQRTYFNLNTRIATLDYIEGKRGASTGTGIFAYRNDYYLDMDYLKMFVSSQQIKFLKRENIAIWIEKKNDEPVKFKLPTAFRLQVIELLEQLSYYNSFDTVYRVYYNKQIKEIYKSKGEQH